MGNLENLETLLLNHLLNTTDKDDEALKDQCGQCLRSVARSLISTKEKEQNAERKAQLEQEASAAWKRTDQLDHNLLSQYMDHEDKWKATLGHDIYKATNLNVDPQMRSRIAQNTREQNISREESLTINKLLFKDGKGHLHDSWK